MYSKETKFFYDVGFICSYIYICTLFLTLYTNLQCPQQQPGTNLCGFYAFQNLISLVESPAIYDSYKLATLSLVSQSLSFTRTANSDNYIIKSLTRFTAAPLSIQNFLHVRTTIFKWLYKFYIE